MTKENNELTSRGVSKESGEFVYGYPVYSKVFGWEMFVEYESLGASGSRETKAVHLIQKPDRCTTLKDSIGKMLFGNDILDKSHYKNFGVLEGICRVEFGLVGDSDGWANEKILGWRTVSSEGIESSLYDLCSRSKCIGNLHHNPKLMEE